jgi:ribonucleoside-diphosphate reductase alpha chain
VDSLLAASNGKNYGWIVRDSFVQALLAEDEEASRKFQKAVYTKLVTGKGYFFFPDKANRHRPQMYKDLGLDIKASNLCSEIMLHSSEEYTYSCILSSLNLVHWDRIKNSDSAFIAAVFLDCLCSEFIEKSEGQAGLEKVRNFTIKGRATGLGVMGFHTNLQSKMVPYTGMEAQYLSREIAEHLEKESLRASQWLAQEYGEPEWCKGYGKRSTHLMAIAPNTSSALICGGVSQGVEPLVANVYTQNSAGGELERMNPALIEIMKARGVYDAEHVQDVAINKGSVLHVDWLTAEEKLVFKTAYEIDQKVIVRMANARSPYIDQGTSLNLFFDADEDEAYISEVHKEAILSPYIKSLYYMRSMAGVTASKGECLVCEG